MEKTTTTLPFCLVFIVVKGVAPVDTSMADIYKAGLPFLVCNAIDGVDHNASLTCALSTELDALT